MAETPLCDAAYDAVADRYDDWYSPEKASIARENDRLAEILRPLVEKRGRLLDAGCGTGLVLDLFPAIDQLDYVGVDVSGKMIEEAEIKHPGYRFAQTSMEHVADLAYRNSFSKIVSTFAFYYSAKPGQTLRGFFRILKPGGMMILVVATARRLREADYIPVDVARRAYDPAQLRGMVSDAGFLPLKCEGLMRKRMPGRDRYFALAAIK